VVVFTLELTHDISALPLFFIGTTAAHTLTVLMLRRSILTEKVARRGFHIHREYTVDRPAMLRVEDVMDPQVQTVPVTMTVRELFERIVRYDPDVSRHHALVIVGNDGAPNGIVTRGDLIRALDKNPEMLVMDAGSRDLVVAFPGELVADAADRLLRNDIGRLPVVTRGERRRLVGYLGRPGILRARMRRVDEEHKREVVSP
jgi:chloride channel protein, CIC family